MDQLCNLNNLGSGQVVIERTSAVPTVVTETQTVQKFVPTASIKIDSDQVNSGEQNVYEQQFLNGSAATKLLPFSGLFSEPGDFARFERGGFGSAFDEPLVTMPGHVTPGGSALFLQAFDKMIEIMPMIFGKIQITASSQAQADQKLILSTINMDLEECNQTKSVPTCDACPNNNNPDVFVRTFNGPFSVGDLQSLFYPLLAGEQVTVKVWVAGVNTIHDYKQLDC